MKVKTLIILLIVFLVGISFILMGLATDELSKLSAIDATRETDLAEWKKFLAPYVVGIPEP